MSLYLFIIGFVSVIVAIAMALISLNWFFRDGDDSARSLEEFNRWGYFDDINSLLTTKFGWWLLVSGGAGCLCFLVLSKLAQWLHHGQ